MNIVDKIKSLLQEAELYRSQSLLNEAHVRYENAANLIRKHEKLKGREKTLKGIEAKMASLKAEITRIEQADQTPELSSDIQEIIKKKFSFAADREDGALDGAIALAKFGQYKAALKEFQALIKEEQHRIVAAKSIVRCHISLKTFDEIVEQYREWAEGDLLTPDQLENIRVFINSMLSKRGFVGLIPEPGASGEPESDQIESPELNALELEVPGDQPAPVGMPPLDIPGIEIPGIEMPDSGDNGLTEEDLDDVNAIGITLQEGPFPGKLIEYEISFHSGTEITVIIPEKQKDLAILLKPGYKINDVQFYTPFAMLAGKCIVESNTKIGTGPKRGDFSVDIRVITS